MDRNWIFANRLTKEYEDGVEEFINFAMQNAKDPSKIPCPCTRCLNANRKDANGLRDDLIINGIDQTYTCWTCHGETEHTINMDNMGGPDFEVDQLEEMIQVVGENFHDRSDMFDEIKRDAREPLYASCRKFSKLSAVLKLFHLKASNGWTDKSFTSLLQLLRDILPDDNVLPDSTYMAKKLVRSLSMGYERIHACPNDCILYRNEYASLEKCPNSYCGRSRYKRKGVPAKVLWYFPIIPRFKRLFSNVEDAKNLRWHAEDRKSDGQLRHPADATQWVNFDTKFPDFGHEGRNLRLALSIDGVNPHGNQSSTHSTWPVILVIYNLPPWLCMKRKCMMLSLLISGPKQPGNDIDVYLAPLIEDLKLLWDCGVEVYDAYGKQNFCMRAMLFCTINDFPAYGNLSGYTVKGKHACPICEDQTAHTWLENSKKTVYLACRRFFPIAHRYRKLKKAFNGEFEEAPPPQPLTTQQLMAKLNVLNIPFGKKRAKPLPSVGWKKKSIFFSLPYWEHLYVRHCLDVMHIEKNVCDSLLGTLLNVPGKTKDSANARKDMVDMGIRLELEGQVTIKRTYLPPASYTLSNKENDDFCRFFQAIKVPHGFSSNIKNLLNFKGRKLQGMKSHDCHVIMQEFLPVAIRGILPKHILNAITRLCFFFKKICSKVINPHELNSLQNDIVLTICELEMIFPPSFFDIMVHLTIHLVREVRLCGPVYLRWMYPFERFMKVLKGYVMNTFRPEGCMVERYIMEEATEFCALYLSDIEPIGLSKSVKNDPSEGRGTAGFKMQGISRELWEQAHLYVIHNSEEVEVYVDEHMSYLRSQNPRRSEKWITDQHNVSFTQWLRVKIENSVEPVSPTLASLSRGPLFSVASFSAYEINGYTFYTKCHDDTSTMQNSGVTLVAQAMHISSAKDKNPVQASLSYYGVIEEIWELNYLEFIVPIFLCKWVNFNGVEVDSHGFTRVDLNRVGHKNDPFNLASQAKQVFFVPDPKDPKWSIVISTKESNHNEYDEVESELSHTSVIMPTFDANVDEEAHVYMREDHAEGIIINQAKRKRQ